MHPSSPSADLPERLYFQRLCFGRAVFVICSEPLLNRGARHPASAAQLSAPQFSKCNGDDRSQRLKQGGAVGAAASKTRAPLKVRSGCWEPQPGGTFPTALLRQSRFCCRFPQNGAYNKAPPLRVWSGGALLVRFYSRKAVSGIGDWDISARAIRLSLSGGAKQGNAGL